MICRGTYLTSANCQPQRRTLSRSNSECPVHLLRMPAPEVVNHSSKSGWLAASFAAIVSAGELCMAKLRGLGPVFAFESLIAMRRWQTYALRCVYVGLLLVGLTLTWGPSDRTIRTLAAAATTMKPSRG